MSQHYTGNTLSVSKYCRNCRKHTQHRVDNHVVTNVCLECPEKKVSSASSQERSSLFQPIEGSFAENSSDSSLSNPRKVPDAVNESGRVELLLLPDREVFIPLPCTCSRYPFGHYHAIQKYGDAYPRFKAGTWEENRA